MKKVHPLVKAARDRVLDHPGQLEKFDQKKWIAHAEILGTQDEEAVAFFAGASWLNGHFHRVALTRRQFTWGGEEAPDHRELICAHIAGANYAFWQVMAEQEKYQESIEEPAAEQLVLSKSSMVGNSDPLGVNRVIMHRLDSLRWAVWELFQYKDNITMLFPEKRPHKLAPMDFFLAELRMSQYYHNFTELWQELLYGHARFHAQPGKVFFTLRHPDYHRMKCIAEFRREHQQVTGIQQTSVVLRLIGVTPEWPCYLSYLPDRTITTVPWDELTEKTQLTARFQTLAPFSQLDDHLRPLLKSQQNAVIERSLQVCMNIWVHFAVLSEQITEALKTYDDVRGWHDLLAMAPRFNRSLLQSLLCQCTGYAVTEIDKALTLLTWQGKKPQDDLWAQPLIRMEEVIVFPISAFLTGSISRNVDCWMNKLDGKDAQRGKMFEQDLTRLFEECRSENAVMKNHLHYTPGVEPCYGGESEEIDATFSFGKLLVVVEARSRKTPITPLDFENELHDTNGLIKKTAQAERKAEFVRKHLKRFCLDYYPHLVEKGGLIVHPLVVVNGQFHAGYPFNGTPVIDTALLLHFLKDAEVKFMFDPVKEEHQYGLKLWTTLAEAEDRFDEYVRHPELIRIYESLCKASEISSNNLGEGFEEVVTQTYDMQFESWELFMAVIKRDFAGKLLQYF